MCLKILGGHGYFSTKGDRNRGGYYSYMLGSRHRLTDVADWMLGCYVRQKKLTKKNNFQLRDRTTGRRTVCGRFYVCGFNSNVTLTEFFSTMRIG
jgi:hypothetical protein